MVAGHTARPDILGITDDQEINSPISTANKCFYGFRIHLKKYLLMRRTELQMYTANSTVWIRGRGPFSKNIQQFLLVGSLEPFELAIVGREGRIRGLRIVGRV